MRWSTHDLNSYEARRLKQPSGARGTDNEAELQRQIIDYCKSKSWIVFYTRMDKPTTARIGQPDLTILADKGRVLLVECKTRVGKLTPEQAAIAAWASRLGHTILLVRSFDEFLALISTE